MRTGRSGSLWILMALLPVLLILALSIGRFGILPVDTVRSLFGLDGVSAVVRSLILRVRLPRVIAALCIGANLAVSGAAFQGLFRNPLVDSRILGVSSGAAFGAAFALLISANAILVQVSAFAFALFAIGLVCFIGWRFGSSTLALIIVGVLVSAFFNALLGVVKYIADPLSSLPAITYWLLGSLNGIRWAGLPPLLMITGIGVSFFLVIRWRLNLLTLSDAEALSLGMKVKKFRVAVILIGAVLVAISVSAAGIIGWIGLVIPHVARALVGPDHVRLIPVSVILGALSLLAIDTIARTVLSSEIPLGILTGLIGVPAFSVLFARFMHVRKEAS